MDEVSVVWIEDLTNYNIPFKSSLIQSRGPNSLTDAMQAKSSEEGAEKLMSRSQAHEV